MNRRPSRQKKVATGSPVGGEPVFLAVGKLRRPHGLQGEIIMDLLTDFPERLQPGGVVYMDPDHAQLTLRSVRIHNTGRLVAFQGYDSPEAVGELRNRVVYVQTADRPPLPEGEYYHHQIVNLDVYDEAGKMLGSIQEILETGANDVYVVRSPDGREILLPAIDQVVLQIDLANKRMLVRLMPGLVDDPEEG